MMGTTSSELRPYLCVSFTNTQPCHVLVKGVQYMTVIMWWMCLTEGVLNSSSDKYVQMMFHTTNTCRVWMNILVCEPWSLLTGV